MTSRPHLPLGLRLEPTARPPGRRGERYLVAGPGIGTRLNVDPPDRSMPFSFTSRMPWRPRHDARPDQASMWKSGHMRPAPARSTNEQDADVTRHQRPEPDVGSW